MEYKPEKYRGLTIIFFQQEGRIIAGFPKRPRVVSGRTKREAFDRIKEVVSRFDPIVFKTYEKYPKVMAELEEM